MYNMRYQIRWTMKITISKKKREEKGEEEEEEEDGKSITNYRWPVIAAWLNPEKRPKEELEATCFSSALYCAGGERADSRSKQHLSTSHPIGFKCRPASSLCRSTRITWSIIASSDCIRSLRVSTGFRPTICSESDGAGMSQTRERRGGDGSGDPTAISRRFQSLPIQEWFMNNELFLFFYHEICLIPGLDTAPLANDLRRLSGLQLSSIIVRARVCVCVCVCVCACVCINWFLNK